jgi:hypothetical protein
MHITVRNNLDIAPTVCAKKFGYKLPKVTGRDLKAPQVVLQGFSRIAQGQAI